MAKDSAKSQRQKFIDKARELGCDEDEDAFKQKLKRIAETGASKSDNAKKSRKR